MATKMTRAEYEETYGSSPVISQSNIDNRPAPIRMTQAEYNAQYRPKQQTFKEDAKQDFKEMGQGIAKTIDEGTSDRQRIKDRVTTGDISPVEGTFKTLGLGLKTGFNTIFEGGLGLAKMALPQSVEEKTGEVVSGAVTAVIEKGKSDMERLRQGDETEQKIAAQIDEAMSLYKKDEDFRDTVNAAGGFMDAILSVGGGKAVSKGADVATGVAKKIDVAPLVKKVTQPKDIKIETRRVKDLSDLEDKYANLRKLNEFSPDGGKASRSRIARSNVLEGISDEDGVIRTKGKGGAVEAYRAATIDGVEDVVSRNLAREGKTVSIPEITDALRLSIVDSGLEGADLVTALKGVEKEMKGLSLRMNEMGQVDLTKLQDAKISTTRNINFNTPPETKTYRKAVARAYKELIEKKSDFNVKEVNEELANFYKDIERLEALDGKRVKGGRLGKYFAQVSGNIIGGAAGSAAGGPLGTALGTIAGGEAASFIAGKTMKRSFGKGGILPQKNAILEQALKDAGLPPGRSLNVPDPIIGIPKITRAKIDELATPAQKKEIAKVQKQMADNVKQQKVAVKAKDYTLVDSLKKVYDSLIVRMKTLVSEIVESVKNPTIGLSIKKTVSPELVAKKMDFEDMQDVTTFLEDPQGALLNDKLMRMVDEMGIGKADLETQVDFLREVTDEADRLGLLQSNNLGKRNTQYQATNNISKNVIKDSVPEKSKDVTPKTDNSLSTQAKGKTLNEFIESQGTPVYHGTTKTRGGEINMKGFNPYKDIPRDGGNGYNYNGQGTYFSDSPVGGKDYGETVVEAYIPQNLNILEDPSAPTWIKEDTSAEALTARLRAEGYDGVKIPTYEGSKEFTLLIFDPEKVKTRSQLEDIWKKANAES